MRKFKNFKYNKIRVDTDFPFSKNLTEIHYIKDLKYGRKISLIEYFWKDAKDYPSYEVAYYDKESKKGKHNWYVLCDGFSLEDSLKYLNRKVNHWKKCDYLNHI